MATNNGLNLALSGQTGTGSFVGSASPTFTGTPVLSTASATSLTFTSTSGIIGTTTNNNAAAGSVGEYIEQVILYASAAAITRNTVTNCFSISLTAGDWDVFGNLLFATVGTTANSLTASISTVSANVDDNAYINQINLLTGDFNINTGLTFPTRRISLSGSATIYGIGIVTNVAGNGTYCGYIAARRVR